MRNSLPFTIEVERTRSGWNFTRRFIDADTPNTPWRFEKNAMITACIREAGNVIRAAA